jgi:predicted Abi (CAAX) family protease
MPKPNERKPDGGVWFEVYDAPGGKTFSKPIWLSWNPSNPQMKDYYDRTVIDVTISAADFEHSRTSTDMVPERLHGLKRVSFLESLAGARTKEHAEIIRGKLTADSMEVFLPKAHLAGDTLLTDSEPVQIVGKSVMLLKFVKKSGNLTYEAKKWVGGSFSSESIHVKYQKPAKDPNVDPGQPTIEGIEKNDANADGWYAYGDFIDGKFEVRALEPRAAMMLGRARFVPDGNRYIDSENFDNTRKQKGRISVVALRKSGETQPPRGTRGLFVHVFGGIDGLNGDKPITIPLTNVKYYTGHFSFGVAEVQTDPFTGQPRLDLEYRQVYANNVQAITSGANKWHSFSGSLQRGWMYSRPISDAVIWHPALSRKYKINGGIFDPLEGILQELSIMGGRFRSGDGAGSAKVTEYTSCAQDSNQAVFISLSKFLDWTKESEEVKALIAQRESRAEGQLLSELKDIAEEYKRRVISFAGLRTEWLKARDAELAVHRMPANQFGVYLAAIASRKFLTPDWANKEVLKIFYDQGALLWFVRTNQVGGLKPNIFPTAVGFD